MVSTILTQITFSIQERAGWRRVMNGHVASVIVMIVFLLVLLSGVRGERIDQEIVPYEIGDNN